MSLNSPYNNPYVPGDPGCYDLKWIVARIKEILAQLGTLDEAIEAKIFEGFLEHSIVQFKTVPEMLAADITDGSIVLTLGYHEAGDLGGLFYLVKDFNPSQCALDYFLTMDNNAQIAIPVVVTPYVTPEMFGAYGDGVSDDTKAFNVAVNYGEVILKKSAVYMIDAVEHVLMTGGTIEGNSATLKIIPNDAEHYAAILVNQNTSPVQIKDLTIIGERDQHTGASGEWGHCIHIEGASDVAIDNVKCSEGWGDGIYVRDAENIKITRTICDHNSRNGMSVISVDGLFMDDVEFSRTDRTSPKHGIDFEPNEASEDIKNVRIGTVYTHDNDQAGVTVHSANMVDITIDTLISRKDGGAAIAFNGVGLTPSTQSRVLINNMIVEDVSHMAVDLERPVAEYPVLINNLTVKGSPTTSSANVNTNVITCKTHDTGNLSINSLYVFDDYVTVPFNNILRTDDADVSSVYVGVEHIKTAQQRAAQKSSSDAFVNVLINDPNNCCILTANASYDFAQYKWTGVILPVSSTSSRTDNIKDVADGTRMFFSNTSDVRNLTLTFDEVVVGLTTAANQNVVMNAGSYLEIVKTNGIIYVAGRNGTITV